MNNRIYYSPDSDTLSTSDSAVGEAGAPDSSHLALTALYLSPDGGGTNEEHPSPGVAYDFVATVVNGGTENSGAFFVKFQFNPDTENPNPDADLTVKQDDGLAAGADLRAVSRFGAFPNEHNTYHLEACVYSASAPEGAIMCTAFAFFVNTAD